MKLRHARTNIKEESLDGYSSDGEGGKKEKKLDEGIPRPGFKFDKETGLEVKLTALEI